MSQQNRRSNNNVYSATSTSGVTSAANHRQRIQQLQSPGGAHQQHAVIQRASQHQNQMISAASYGAMGPPAAGSSSSYGTSTAASAGGIGIVAPKNFPMVKQSSQVRQDDSVQQKPNRTAFKPNTLQTSTNYQRHSAAIMPLKQAAQLSGINYGGGFSSGGSSSTNNLPGTSSNFKRGGGVVGRGGNAYYNQHHHQTTSAPSNKSSVVSTQHAIIASAIQDRDSKAVEATDLHDCTNEEQMEDKKYVESDGFDIIDRDEIFDECDEQTGIQRHQMNVGLSRQTKAITHDMFNVFQRQTGATSSQQVSQSEIPQQPGGALAFQMSVGQRPSNSKPLINTSIGADRNNRINKAARDQRNYNDFLRSSSPQINNALSREGSRSPPALDHLDKAAFFGSSFAGNAGILGSARPSVEKNSANNHLQQQLSGGSGVKMNPTNSFGGVIRNNTFALSTVNKFRPQPTGSGATNSRGGSQSPIRTPQDKGPQNFKNLEMGMHMPIPDQFHADLERIEQHQEETGAVDTSLQQETEEAHTYDAPHVLPTTLNHQKRNFIKPSGLRAGLNEQPSCSQAPGAASVNNYVFETDQDTIIDQDDDVAEECSIADQQTMSQHQQQDQQSSQHYLQLQTQSTQHNDGPVSIYRFMMGRRNQEEDIQDETAIEDEDHHAAGFSNRQLAVPTKMSQQQMSGQPSLMSFAPTTNSCAQAPLQQDSAAGATANFHTGSNQNILLASQSSSVTTFSSNLHHKNGAANRHPLANKPRTNMIGGLPPNVTSTASKPRMLLQSSGQINSIGTTRSLSRVSKTSGQPNPSINEKRLYHNNTHATILSNERVNHNMQNSKAAVCETVDDIQESVVVISNNALVHTDAQRKHYPATANTSQTKSQNDIEIKRMDFQQVNANDTPDMRQKAQSSNKTDQRLGASGMQQYLVSGSQGRPTLSKKDNKDSKKVPGDITISELQSSSQQQQVQHHSNIHFENQEMHFSKAAGVGANPLSNLSASQQVMTRTGGLQTDFRQGTFRSPHASPGGKLQMHSTNASHSHSNKGGTSTVKAAGTTMKKALIANQHFFERQKSNKTEALQGEQNSKQGQKNQPFFADDAQSIGHKSMKNAALHQQTSNSVQDTSGVYGTRRDTANFFTAQEHHSASLPKHLNPNVSQQQQQTSSTQKSKAELANEYLELQRTLAQVQQQQQSSTNKGSVVASAVSQLSQNLPSQSSMILAASQKGTGQLFDDSVSQVSKTTVMAHKMGHIRDSSDFGGAALSVSTKGGRQQLASNRQQRNNVVSTRLTPKSSYGAGGAKGPHDGSFEQNEDSSYRAGSNQMRSGRQSKDAASASGGSQVRQVRMSARPYQHKRNMTRENDDGIEITNATPVGRGVLGSPNQASINSQKALNLTKSSNYTNQQVRGGRKSPVPYIKHQQSVAAADHYKETLSAKNFTVGNAATTTADKRFRNARTFVEEDANKDTKEQIQRQQFQGHLQLHNRSIMSNGEQSSLPIHSMQNSTNDDLASHSMVVGSSGFLGGKKPRDKAQLQALAELRQRENHTVQTGQMITARQRSREDYLETPHQHLNQRNHKSGGVAKSTHGDRDETITNGTSENLRQVMRMRQDSSVSPHDTYLRLTGKQTDHQNSASNDQNNSTRNFSKGTFERQMADSVEEQSHDQRPDGEDTSSLRQQRMPKQQLSGKMLAESQPLPDSKNIDTVAAGEGDQEDDDDDEESQNVLSRSQSVASGEENESDEDGEYIHEDDDHQQKEQHQLQGRSKAGYRHPSQQQNRGGPSQQRQNRRRLEQNYVGDVEDHQGEEEGGQEQCYAADNDDYSHQQDDEEYGDGDYDGEVDVDDGEASQGTPLQQQQEEEEFEEGDAYHQDDGDQRQPHYTEDIEDDEADSVYNDDEYGGGDHDHQAGKPQRMLTGNQEEDDDYGEEEGDSRQDGNQHLYNQQQYGAEDEDSSYDAEVEMDNGTGRQNAAVLHHRNPGPPPRNTNNMLRNKQTAQGRNNNNNTHHTNATIYRRSRRDRVAPTIKPTNNADAADGDYVGHPIDLRSSQDFDEQEDYDYSSNEDGQGFVAMEDSQNYNNKAMRNRPPPRRGNNNQNSYNQQIHQQNQRQQRQHRQDQPHRLQQQSQRSPQMTAAQSRRGHHLHHHAAAAAGKNNSKKMIGTGKRQSGGVMMAANNTSSGRHSNGPQLSNNKNSDLIQSSYQPALSQSRMTKNHHNQMQQQQHRNKQPLKINIKMTGSQQQQSSQQNQTQMGQTTLQQQVMQQQQQQQHNNNAGYINNTVVHQQPQPQHQQLQQFNMQPPQPHGAGSFMFYNPQQDQQQQQLLMMQQQHQVQQQYQQFNAPPMGNLGQMQQQHQFQQMAANAANPSGALMPGSHQMSATASQLATPATMLSPGGGGPATSRFSNMHHQHEQQNQNNMSTPNTMINNEMDPSSSTSMQQQRESIQLRCNNQEMTSQKATPSQIKNQGQQETGSGIGWLSLAGGAENEKSNKNISVRKMSSNVVLPLNNSEATQDHQDQSSNYLVGRQKERQNFNNNRNQNNASTVEQHQSSTMDDNNDNMDELWSRLRAHDKKQNSALTAPAVQVKKPIDPSPNLMDEDQEAELMAKPGRWASIDRSQTQEFTLSAPPAAAQSDAIEPPATDRIFATQDQQDEEDNFVVIKKKKAAALIIGFDDDNIINDGSGTANSLNRAAADSGAGGLNNLALAAVAKNPFANRPVLRSQRAESQAPTKQQQALTKSSASVSGYGRLQSKVNNFSGGKAAAAGNKGKGPPGHHLVVVDDFSGKRNQDEHDDGVTVPLGADFKKVTLEQIQAREERLKRIKDQNLIEIFDDSDPSIADLKHSSNIAEAFAAKRRAKHFQQEKGQHHQLDQDLAVARDASCAADGTNNFGGAGKPPVHKAQRVAKTPQELAQIRKAMMKKRHNTVESCNTPQTGKSQNSQAQSQIGGISTQAVSRDNNTNTNNVISISSARQQNNKTPSVKEPNAALMERLAGGKRTQIDKKEMKKLTRINYENLPEIKRRKDEERKKQEALEKKERIAKYNKECKARQRTQLRKKREQQLAAGSVANVPNVVISATPAAAQINASVANSATNVNIMAASEEEKISSVPLSAITLTVVTQQKGAATTKKLQQQ